MGGLALGILGFIVLQLSGMFSIYSANAKKENGIPWNYFLLLTLGYSLIGSGAVILAFGFF